MNDFTNMTGLAGVTLAVAVLFIRLPGISRLARPHHIGLFALVTVVMLLPFTGLVPAAYVRGLTGDLSITTLFLLLLALSRSLSGQPKEDIENRIPLLILVAGAAAGLYPMSLGLGFFDPYRLGYGNSWMLAALLLLVISCYRRFPALAFLVSLAVLAWGLGWYESANLWDYLLDPWLAVYAVFALLKRGVRSLRPQLPQPPKVS